MPCEKCGSYYTVFLYVLDMTDSKKGFIRCGQICNFCGYLGWDSSGDGYANIQQALRENMCSKNENDQNIKLSREIKSP